jgi:hypothetical protein
MVAYALGDLRAMNSKSQAGAGARRLKICRFSG